MGEIAVGRGTREPEVARQIRDIQLAGGTSRAEAKQPGQLTQVGRIGQSADLSVDDPGDVAVEPRRTAPARPVQSGQEAARRRSLQDIRSGHRGRVEIGHGPTEHGIDQRWDNRRVGELGLGERPERQRFHAPSKGVGKSRRAEQASRSGEQEPTRAPRGIHLRLDGKEQLGNPLGLVDSDKPVAPSDEADRIRPCDIENGGVVQGQPRPARFSHHPRSESDLPRLARAGHDHYWGIGQRLDQRFSDVTRPVHNRRLSDTQRSAALSPAIRGPLPSDSRRLGQHTAAV